MSTLFQALDAKTGLIPETSAAAPRKATARPLAEARVLPLQLGARSPLLPFEGRNAQAGEQYRTVRTNLLQHPDAPRMLVVSSSGPGDGKTLTAVNTAGALAMKGETSVLLMDADLRNPSLARTLGLPPGPGLADVLAGECSLEEAVVRTEQFANLYVLPAGKALQNPAELLDSARWRQVCGAVKNGFRFVIVDTPPIEAVTDYDLVQAAADGVIFVVRPDHSDRNACLAGLHKVQAGGKLTGVLINCAEDWFLYKRYGRYPYPGAYPR